jgi:fumiquinazoline A oxidase
MSSTRQKFQAASGFPNLQVYINYDHGDEGPEVWYGEQNLPRLVALKREWDPYNLFGAGNPVPLWLQ